MSNLLLVEDEENIANGLKFNLELEGHAVEWLRDGAAARQVLIDERRVFDLIILDIMLPEMSGLDLCRALRKVGDFTPVLMLTAKQYDKDKVVGLQMGADDYVTKPFNLEELLARIEGLLRRQRWVEARHGAVAPEPSEVLEFRDVMIDFAAHEARVGDQKVKLTAIEMTLMKVFKDHVGRVLTREELLEKAWHTDAPLTTRTVDNFVMRLRKLFEKDPAHPEHILSVRGKGYKFVK